MGDERAVPVEEEEGVWCITGGELSREAARETFRPDGVENLTYNNPYRLEIERVWFDGKIVFAVESGEVEIEFDENRRAVGNKVAQEYQIVYGVDLDERGKLAAGEPERVEGQYNIYDSVPGMEAYSPAVAVQLRPRAPGLQAQYAAVGSRLFEERLPDPEKHGRRELTGALSAAVCGIR